MAVVLGMIAILALSRLAQRSAGRLIEDAATRYRVRKAVSFAAYASLLLCLTIVFRNRLGGLTVAVGIVGAGIAFALQEVIASIAGWIAVVFGRFYKTGDRIQLAGIRGDVIDIGVLRTTLMELGEWVHGDLYNGRIVRVSNSFVFKQAVFDYSADFPFLWDEISVPLRHGGDVPLARKLLAEVAERVVGEYARKAEIAWRDVTQRYNIEPASVVPMITLVVTDNWLEFTLRYAVGFRRRRLTKDLLFQEVLDAIAASEGRIQLASATLELVDADAGSAPVRSPG